ncbi:MAG: DoxX family protein [Candidatus Paceibacterota bacterium]
MKKAKILFWVSTSLIFLFEGVMTALTSGSQMSIDGITSLGYPVYFVTMLAVFKVVGSLALIIPSVPSRVKEWAYAGFGIDFICAFVSVWAVFGFGAPLLYPAIAMIILVISYTQYHKINRK